MKFILLGLASKALYDLALPISLTVLVFLLFLEHAVVPPLTRGLTFPWPPQLPAGQKQIILLLIYGQQVKSSLMLHHEAYVTPLTSSHHRGISSSHITTSRRVSTGSHGWLRQLGV